MGLLGGMPRDDRPGLLAQQPRDNVGFKFALSAADRAADHCKHELKILSRLEDHFDHFSWTSLSMLKRGARHSGEENYAHTPIPARPILGPGSVHP